MDFAGEFSILYYFRNYALNFRKFRTNSRDSRPRKRRLAPPYSVTNDGVDGYEKSSIACDFTRLLWQVLIYAPIRATNFSVRVSLNLTIPPQQSSNITFTILRVVTRVRHVSTYTTFSVKCRFKDSHSRNNRQPRILFFCSQIERRRTAFAEAGVRHL